MTSDESTPKRPRGRPATGRTSATINIRLPLTQIEHMRAQKSASGYVRQLIEADMGGNDADK